MQDQPIYLDNHATTRTDPRVVAAMLPYFTEDYGNPTSRLHPLGQRSADAVDEARASVALNLGAAPGEIVFTSGATESNRLALAAAATTSSRTHFVTTAIEHKTILEGWAGRVTKVGVDASGVVDPAEVRRALLPDTALVSVMAANNEVGTIQPIAEIGRSCRAAGVLFHCDATAGIGRIPLNVVASYCDFVSFSGHKIYGPKGVGALYVRATSGRKVSRPGTPNVPGIVGLAKALALCRAVFEVESTMLLALRIRLLDRLRSGLDAVAVNGDLERRIPGNLNVLLGDIDGRSLVVGLRGLAVSSGSACASAAAEPSHVLLALGRSEREAFASLRFGIGRFNDEAEIDRAAAIVIEAVTKLRSVARSSR